MNRGAKKQHSNFCRLTVVFFLMLVVGIIVYGGVCVARTSSTQAEMPKVKCYTSIEIHYGDTLWGIAEQYMGEEYDSIEDYIQEIRQMNGLTGDRITAGSWLIVSYYVDPVSQYLVQN